MSPLLNASGPNDPANAGATVDTLHNAELFEAIGWLVEGVFCRFFDPVDADVIWIRIQDHVAGATLPADALTNDRVEHIRNLSKLQQPFRDVLQMTEGPTRRFEQPLFPVALLLGDRFASDQQARSITARLWSEGDVVPSVSELLSVSSGDVARYMAGETTGASKSVETIVSYLRFVEHLNASCEFFEYAAGSVPYGVDFESYCQRIGGLNAWRAPLFSSRGVTRFRELTDCVLAVFSKELTDERFPEHWPIFKRLLNQHLGRIANAWETHHLTGFLTH